MPDITENLPVFNPEEEAALYAELGVGGPTEAPAEIQTPDDIVFDDTLIAEYDLLDPQQRSIASRVLFEHYNAARMGVRRAAKSEWNRAVHARISVHLATRKMRTTHEAAGTSLSDSIAASTAAKVGDTAALAAQSALRLLKDNVLDENGEIDLTRLATLLKEA